MEIDINMFNLQRSPLSTLFGYTQEKSLVGFFSTSGIFIFGGEGGINTVWSTGMKINQQQEGS